MAYETILVEKKGATTVVTLNRPEKLNAVNGQMLEEIDQVLAELRQDTATRFVILTGAGRAFSAGADLGGRGPTPAETVPAEAAQAASQQQRLLQMARQQDTYLPELGAGNHRRRQRILSGRWTGFCDGI